MDAAAQLGAVYPHAGDQFEIFRCPSVENKPFLGLVRIKQLSTILRQIVAFIVKSPSCGLRTARI